MLTDKKSLNSSLEIWGGIECSITRINDVFYDQLEYAKHYNREKDLELISELGVKTLRYPILWERHQPYKNEQIDWRWADKQLNALNNFGIKPIAGLVHHGSGPVFTNLSDPHFATGLSEYAEKVAIRYPWIECYTPVNEPLTTARFSGLYGLWYPHCKNDISFVKMLLNQLKGIVLSMSAIRKINPDAKLIQTEDLGKTYSTQSLRYQANFENERRWLTFDILCGKLQPGHPMWGYFIRLGISEASLHFFLENPCPPDIAGLNYYITSERFIDENIQNYPAHTYGSNELQDYADTEAVRVTHIEKSGLKTLLQEAWERYGLPMAITEAHLNCTREEQLRWLSEIWKIAERLKGDGLNIRAVTAWSLFGAFGWNKLLTCGKMEYEAGVFDLRSTPPRPTALATFIRSLSPGELKEHPVLKSTGWWHRNSRFRNHHSPVFETVISKEEDAPLPVLIIGKRGTLGKAFERLCHARAINCVLSGRDEVDITQEKQIVDVINKYKPWAVINAAGFVKVDDAETVRDKCFSENTLGPKLLAKSCKEAGIQFMTFSSDLVFNGLKKTPYYEDDQMDPINIYGKSKADGEVEVMQENSEAMIVRTSSFFGPWDNYNFISMVLQQLSQNKKFIAADNIYVSPTYVPDLVNVCLDLLIDKEKGIWHLTNNGEISWAELASKVARKAGYNSYLIQQLPATSMNWKAQRPLYSVLKSRKGTLLPTLDSAINRYFEERNDVFAQPAVLIN